MDYELTSFEEHNRKSSFTFLILNSKLNQMSPELTTTLLATLPITELRLALPAGVALGLAPLSAFFWATLGNILAVVLTTYILEPVVNFLRRHIGVINRLAEKIFTRTRHKHSENFNRFGALFLVIFVAIPLPGSGGYTGALLTYLFGIPRKTASLLLALGIIGSGVIVLGLTTGWLAFAAAF